MIAGNQQVNRRARESSAVTSMSEPLPPGGGGCRRARSVVTCLPAVESRCRLFRGRTPILPHRQAGPRRVGEFDVLTSEEPALLFDMFWTGRRRRRELPGGGTHWRGASFLRILSDVRCPVFLPICIRMHSRFSTDISLSGLSGGCGPDRSSRGGHDIFAFNFQNPI